MEKKTSVFNNAMWIIGGKIFQSVLALVVNLLTARYLGPSNYGIISYAASLIAFVTPIAYLGFDHVLVQEITIHSKEEGGIIGSSIVATMISSFFSLLGVTTYSLIADWGQLTTTIVVALYGLMLFSQSLELIKYWFQAKLLSKYMSIVSLFAFAFVSGYKIFLLATKQNIAWFAISNSIDYFIIAVALIIIYRKLGGQKLFFSKEIVKRMWNSSKHFIVSSLMVVIYAQTDKIMLKQMLGNSAAGLYSAAVSTAGLTSFIFCAIIDSFRPVIFKYKDQNNKKYESSIEQLYGVVIYFALLQSLVITILAPLLIQVLYGSSYSQSSDVLRIVVWYTTFSYMGPVRNIWILAENKQQYMWIINLSGALANVIMNLLLIPVFGMIGAAIASLLTQFFTNVVMSMLIKPLRHNNTLIVKGLNPKPLLGYFKVIMQKFKKKKVH